MQPPNPLYDLCVSWFVLSKSWWPALSADHQGSYWLTDTLLPEPPCDKFRLLLLLA